MKRYIKKSILLALALITFAMTPYAQKTPLDSFKLVLKVNVGPADAKNISKNLTNTNNLLLPYGIQIKLGKTNSGTTTIEGQGEECRDCGLEFKWNAQYLEIWATKTPPQKIVDRVVLIAKEGSEFMPARPINLNLFDTNIVDLKLVVPPTPQEEPTPNLWLYATAKQYAMFGQSPINKDFGSVFSFGIRNKPWWSKKWGFKVGLAWFPKWDYKAYEPLPDLPEQPAPEAGWNDCNCDPKGTFAVEIETSYRFPFKNTLFGGQWGIMLVGAGEIDISAPPSEEVPSSEWNNAMTLTLSPKLYWQKRIGKRGEALTISTGPMVQALPHANHWGFDLLNITGSLPAPGNKSNSAKKAAM